MGIPHPRTIQKMIASMKPYTVVDVTTNKVVARFESDVEAAEKANERPRDWLSVHESHLAGMGVET